MLYEKKMLILSGDGKGVVLIEKSGRGIKLALRTFDMPPCAPLKAGIITKRSVTVRDLPYKDNPAAVINIELDDISDLHFAVFDRKLRLYGCTGKRMWESNLMDLLDRHEHRAPVLDGVPHAALPPIAAQPKVLPMPDGTGIPQTRLAVYGDDALAENDFYTSIDMTGRMPVVDSFLSTPRALDALAPRVISTDKAEDIEDNKSEQAVDEEKDKVMPLVYSVESDAEKSSEEENGDANEEAASANSDDAVDDNTTAAEIEKSADSNEQVAENAEASKQEKDNTSKPEGEWVLHIDSPMQEAAATGTAAEEIEVEPAAATSADMPWEVTARWIKRRSGRELKVNRPKIKPIPASEQIRHLRSTHFFERVRQDIDILFANAPRDEKLSGLLDDVEWVKVDVDGNTISVGRNGNVFLCYAVAGAYEKNSPLGDEAQWLPAVKNAPTGKGYWLIFQNLSTGEIIK